MTQIFDITPAPSAAAGAFPFEDWIKAPTSGQPTPISIGTITPDNSSSHMIPIDADRKLALYRDASGYPTARITTKAGGTPSAGSAVTITSVSGQIMFERRLPGTNLWMVGADNDLFLIDCGASGTTVTVTSVSSNAGDAGKGEAFSRDITDIVFSDDLSYFVVFNVFNNGGTHSFVSALFTITYSGTPAATYVTRDVDATGSAAALASASGYYISNGVAHYFGINTTDNTTLRTNKVSFTSSTVANTTANVTLGTTITGGQLRNNRIISRAPRYDDDHLGFAYTIGSNRIITVWVDISSGSPVIYNESVPFNGTDYPLTNGIFPHALDVMPMMVVQSSGTAIAVQNRANPFPSRPLLTGLTATVNVNAYAFSSDYNWCCGLGYESTNSGLIFWAKNADA